MCCVEKVRKQRKQGAKAGMCYAGEPIDWVSGLGEAKKSTEDDLQTEDVGVVRKGEAQGSSSMVSIYIRAKLTVRLDLGRDPPADP